MAAILTNKGRLHGTRGDELCTVGALLAALPQEPLSFDVNQH